VIFCDLESDTLQIDPDEIEAKIQADTRAVVVVHVGGIITPHWDRIQEICAKHRVVLIEDAAHAHGAWFHGRMAGSLGLAGAFSFFPTKVLTTAEGGMITTHDPNLAAEARILRDHGKQSGGSSPHVRIGDNWRPSELHAVLGLQQMKKADWILGERRRLAKLYDQGLPGIPELRPLKIPEGVQSSYYKYIVFLDPGVDRNDLKKRMREEFDVALTGEVYADPCHLQPVFERHPEFLGRPLEPLPRTESAAFHHACLPLYPGLTDDDIYYVVESLKKALE
jgi:dTDP-4-amino-4,6-dideoxygalactose transaminase